MGVKCPSLQQKRWRAAVIELNLIEDSFGPDPPEWQTGDPMFWDAAHVFQWAESEGIKAASLFMELNICGGALLQLLHAELVELGMKKLPAKSVSSRIDKLDQAAAAQYKRETVRPIPTQRRRTGTFAMRKEPMPNHVPVLLPTQGTEASPTREVKAAAAGTPTSPTAPNSDDEFDHTVMGLFLGRGAFADTFLVQKTKKRDSSQPPIPGRQYAKKIISCKSKCMWRLLPISTVVQGGVHTAT